MELLDERRRRVYLLRNIRHLEAKVCRSVPPCAQRLPDRVGESYTRKLMQ